MSTQRIEGMVSTIIPVYNRPAQLVEAVNSVLAQDHRPIEILIIDDGSTDGATPAVAEQLRQGHPGLIHVDRQKNAGPGLARERGRLQARGEFVQYLDSDDVLLPGKFAAQVEALRNHPEADVAYGITLLRHADGSLADQPNKRTGILHPRMFPEFLNQRWWNTSTPLYRSSVLDKAGAWSDLRLEEDWEYDCRVAALGGRLVQVPRPVSEHRVHEGPRLSVGERLDPTRLAMRARSHTLVWGHALRAGLPESAPAEVARFARALFLLSRQCGAAGLAADAERLLGHAHDAVRAAGARSFDLRVYAWIAKRIGHGRVGRLSVGMDQLRNRLRAR